MSIQYEISVFSQEELNEAISDNTFNKIKIEEDGKYEIKDVDIDFIKIYCKTNNASLTVKNCKASGQLRFKGLREINIIDSESSFLTIQKTGFININGFKLSHKKYLEDITPFTMSEFTEANLYDIECKHTGDERNGVALSSNGSERDDNRVTIESCKFEGFEIGVAIDRSDVKIVESKFLDSETGIRSKNSDVKILNLDFYKVTGYLETKGENTINIKETPEILLNRI